MAAFHVLREWCQHVDTNKGCYYSPPSHQPWLGLPLNKVSCFVGRCKNQVGSSSNATADNEHRAAVVDLGQHSSFAQRHGRAGPSANAGCCPNSLLDLQQFESCVLGKLAHIFHFCRRRGHRGWRMRHADVCQGHWGKCIAILLLINIGVSSKYTLFNLDKCIAKFGIGFVRCFNWGGGRYVEGVLGFLVSWI